MVLICWKHEINKLLQFRMIHKICIGCNLWFNEITPLEDEIYPQGVNLPQVKNHCLR